MARSHVMFVQSQRLPWAASPFAARADVDVRLLSRDAATGAATALLRYPPGWQRPQPEWLRTMEEFLVLDGELVVNDVSYAHHCYGCLPAGFVRRHAASPRGATVLTLWDAEPRVVPGVTAPAGAPDPAQPALRHDALARGLDGWDVNPHSRYLPGTGVQTLRVDPRTKEITILYSALPFRFMEKRWTHEHVQEMYVLAGEYSINDVGVMRPGAYAWWNPERLHGPYGSLTGFMMLVRSCGGPLVNVMPDERIPVDFAAPYRPVLPPELMPYAGESDTHRCF